MMAGDTVDTIRFYDVRNRVGVDIPRERVTKTTFVSNTGRQTRYALRGENEDGRIFTKFVTKEYWDSIP